MIRNVAGGGFCGVGAREAASAWASELALRASAGSPAAWRRPCRPRRSIGCSVADVGRRSRSRRRARRPALQADLARRLALEEARRPGRASASVGRVVAALGRSVVDVLAVAWTRRARRRGRSARAGRWRSPRRVAVGLHVGDRRSRRLRASARAERDVARVLEGRRRRHADEQHAPSPTCTM